MKYLKYLLTIVIISFAMVLTGCSSNESFYKKWTDAGVEFKEENCFEDISLDDAKEKINNKDTFVLVIAAPEYSSNVTDMQTIYNTSVYLEFNGKIQVLDVTDYNTTTSKRNSVKEALNIDSIINISSGLIFVVYDEGNVILDTSDTSVAGKAKYEAYASEDGSINVEKFVSYIFVDFKF